MSDTSLETTSKIPLESPKGTFPAKVARVIDKHKLVINKGKMDGIRESQRMLVYYIDDEEIKDPDTGKSLGYLELVKGTGKIIFVDEKYSILESDRVYEPYKPMPSFSSFPTGGILDKQKEELREYLQGTLRPFDNPQVKDLVKPI